MYCIFILVKITWHVELGKGIPLYIKAAPEPRCQQAIEQQM